MGARRSRAAHGGEARVRFGDALAREETPEAFEGAGLAARYELDAEAAIEAHERGYRLARSRGDAATAARLAIQLCHDAYAFRGPAEASGWVERAALLVEGEPASVATAWVSLLRAHFALSDHQPDVALEGSAHAIALAREVQAVDVEMLALALNGLALVSTGEIEDGMRRLDAAAAAAVGGEMTDADSIETVCCHMIDACKLVRDLERATEWCLRVREIATRFADRQMSRSAVRPTRTCCCGTATGSAPTRSSGRRWRSSARCGPGVTWTRSPASPSCGAGRDGPARRRSFWPGWSRTASTPSSWAAGTRPWRRRDGTRGGSALPTPCRRCGPLRAAALLAEGGSRLPPPRPPRPARCAPTAPSTLRAADRTDRLRPPQTAGDEREQKGGEHRGADEGGRRGRSHLVELNRERRDRHDERQLRGGVEGECGPVARFEYSSVEQNCRHAADDEEQR
jgi:hypothetical protein